MKKFNLILKKMLLCSWIVLGISSCSKTKYISVGFVNVNDSIKENLQIALTQITENEKYKLRFSDLTVLEAVENKNVDLIITTAGYSERTITAVVDKKSGIKQETVAQMTPSMKQVANIQKGIVKSVPILSDNMEIAIDMEALELTNINAIQTWNDVQRFSETQKGKIENPVIFAGGDSVQFFDILGSICEALDGQNSYEKAAAILEKASKAKKFDPKKVAGDLTEKLNSPMPKTKKVFCDLMDKNYISYDTFNYSKTDVKEYADAKMASVILMTLSDHRTISKETISRYEASYIPANSSKSNRYFTATTIYAIPFSTEKTVCELTEQLVTVEGQDILSNVTGLAPVLRNSHTADSNSYDVRYWITSTERPNAGLGHETALSESQLKQIKTELLGNFVK